MDAIQLDPVRLHIGQTRQFFLDNAIIESVQSLTRRVHSPTPEPGPVIYKDKPWEHVPYFTCNGWRVIRDPADGLFKCWYDDWGLVHDEYLRQVADFNDPEHYPFRVLYAQSADGMHWEKPALDLVLESGERTGIVLGDPRFGGARAAYVFLDPFEARQEHRYKAVFEHIVPGRITYEIASSSDGLHWRPWEQLPSMGRWGPRLGDVLTVAVDESSHMYLLNTRHVIMNKIFPVPQNPVNTSFNHPYYPEWPTRSAKRRIFRLESGDLIHWSNPEPILVPDDELDNLDDAFYGMVQYKTGEMWIGFLNVLHMTANTMDVQLVFSRDGRRFKRLQPGRPWLAHGETGSWNQYLTNVCSPPVQVGDDLYVYHGGARNSHDWWLWGMKEELPVPEATDLSQVAFGLGLAKMKVDRYVSLSANGVREGLLVTKPFSAEGGRLHLNARCGRAGYLRAAVASGEGHVLPGLSKDECLPFSGDAVDHEITWESQRELPAGWLKLHIYLKAADLFTFEVRR